MNNEFSVGDIIVPRACGQLAEDMRREILEVGDTHYTLKFLSGKQLVVKWPIHGVDGDHRPYDDEGDSALTAGSPGDDL